MKESSCQDRQGVKGEISIFGFGSYFKGKKVYQDIDLLLLHENSSKESCYFALSCKKHISSKIPYAHITILSKSGELQHNFIRKSNAIFLGQFDDKSSFDLLDIILDKKIFIEDITKRSSGLAEAHR